jgi:amidase
MAISWEKTAEDKRNRIFQSIPEEWRIESGISHGDSVMEYPKISRIMTDVELTITESSAVDLVAQMAAGQLTSVAVTTAFCKRAALAHQLVSKSPKASFDCIAIEI